MFLRRRVMNRTMSGTVPPKNPSVAPDTAEKTVWAVFFRIGAVDEVHIQRHGGQITATVKGVLRRLPHFGEALSAGLYLFPTTLGGLLGSIHGQVDPLDHGVVVDMGTVDVQLWQIHFLSTLLSGATR